MATRATRLLSAVNVDVATLTLPIGMQPTTQGSIFNSALPAAEASWFATNISITESGIMRITVQVSVTGNLRMAITRSGTTIALKLNENTALIASALYTFDVPVKALDAMNLRYSVTTGTIDYCEVQFIKGGV